MLFPCNEAIKEMIRFVTKSLVFELFVLLWYRKCFSSCGNSVSPALLKFIGRFISSGISLKTQELYVFVFLARYLDLFTRYYSFYNTVMKLVFIGTSVCIVWYMRFHKVVKQTYSKDQDTFRHYFLIPPCFLLALLVHRSFTVMEVRSSYVFCFGLTLM